MATKKTPAADVDADAAAAPAAVASVTFTDSTFTSRSLFLQQGDTLRQFDVVRQRLTVPADDVEALAFLDAQDDLQRLDG